MLLTESFLFHLIWFQMHFNYLLLCPVFRPFCFIPCDIYLSLFRSSSHLLHAQSEHFNFFSSSRCGIRWVAGCLPRGMKNRLTWPSSSPANNWWRSRSSVFSSVCCKNFCGSWSVSMAQTDALLHFIEFEVLSRFFYGIKSTGRSFNYLYTSLRR